MQKKTHDAIWTSPRGYYFCNVIAVDSEMRGMGVGKLLMDVVTTKADAEGVPCYLESSKGMPNLRIYEKMGFNLLTDIECVDKGESCKVSVLPKVRYTETDGRSCIVWLENQRCRFYIKNNKTINASIQYTAAIHIHASALTDKRAALPLDITQEALSIFSTVSYAPR